MCWFCGSVIYLPSIKWKCSRDLHTHVWLQINHRNGSLFSLKFDWRNQVPSCEMLPPEMFLKHVPPLTCSTEQRSLMMFCLCFLSSVNEAGKWAVLKNKSPIGCKRQAQTRDGPPARLQDDQTVMADGRHRNSAPEEPSRLFEGWRQSVQSTSFYQQRWKIKSDAQQVICNLGGVVARESLPGKTWQQIIGF